MKPTQRNHSRITAHRGTATLAVAAALTLSALLAGCSAGEASGSADQSVQEDAGSSALGGAGSPAEAPQAGADTSGTGSSTDPANSGTDAAATTADDQRQVILTGDIVMTVKSPQETAEAIVALTEKAGGRIDNRTERAATEATVATAELTIRIPSTSVNATVLALRSLGSVDTIELGTTDVTSVSEDLDARIAGLQISVARATDMLSKAGTNAEIAEAEAALTERQTNLEKLQSEKARLGEQVALSTLKIALQGPEVASPPPPPEPAPVEPGPDSFLDGLSAGWASLVGILSGVATVFGVLLPWLVLGGLLAWAVVALYRRYQRTHPQSEPGPIEHERIPVGVGAPTGPGQPPTAPPAHDPYAR